MVECEGCARWVHIQCDGIDDDTYKQMAQDDVHYLCPVCRKEKPDPSERNAEKELTVTNSKTSRKATGEHTKSEKRKRRKFDDEFVDIED